MAMPRFWITTSSQSPTLLYTRSTHKGQTGRLASLAPHRLGWAPYDLFTHTQRHCSTWAEQSRIRSLPFTTFGLENGTSLGRYAGAIPGVDKAAALVRW